MASAISPASGAAFAPRIIWHFGFQKTGTTAVQWLLRKNRALLGEKIALFPRGRWTAALREAAAVFLRTRSEADKTAFQDEVRKIVNTVRDSGHRCAIVSDENVLGLKLRDETGDIFTHARTMLPVVEDAAAPAICEFHFNTRDTEAWLKSAHNQEVKQLRCRQDFDEWRNGVALPVDWSALHDTLSGLTQGAVVFRDMNADRAAGRPSGAALLEAAGVGPELLAQLKTPGAQNESLSDAALAFMLDINRSPLKRRQIGAVRDVVVKNMGLFK